MPKKRGEGNKRGLGNIYNMKAQGELFRGTKKGGGE